MKLKFIFSLLTISLLLLGCKDKQYIPIEYLSMELSPNKQEQQLTILNNEIKGVTSEHIAITSNITKKVELKEGYKTIYLFIKGYGNLTSGDSIYSIVPETIMLPNTVEDISFKPVENDTLHYLKISVLQTELDKEDIKTFPTENTNSIYFKKFTDCKPYTEPIKSPQTTSRTILPNKYIPRVAMGTVKTIGPDAVGAHEHAMLEQLFLGLANNQTIVYADDAQVNFPEYSLLHIPRGSSHSVSVNADNEMYYVWMDFFVDKDGEEWLKTHNTVDE
ncbi:hypothetical protein CLV33_105267 [Jejuia pallidilutea]|uniref:Uncharacterized protein n=1 Tax=Jejuia pallidilutea TaxID=504487 RepID=A0A362WZM0_9FLAO|nr:cupin domain-containing protein [Jejuia pallidilutea]PQV48408.1 hypothetical protein CLV33_105267 [Jejuia pallidilutea]